MSKECTHFQTKTAQKPYPLGRHTYMAFQGSSSGLSSEFYANQNWKISVQKLLEKTAFIVSSETKFCINVI